MNMMTDALAYDISDESLELAGGLTPNAQAGSSLWSTIQVSGCTCVG
jgi:hypothetical protein